MSFEINLLNVTCLKSHNCISLFKVYGETDAPKEALCTVLKVKIQLRQENLDPTVHNLCLVAAPRHKPNNSGLTQRMNLKNPCHFYNCYFALQSSLNFHCCAECCFQSAFSDCHTRAAISVSLRWLLNIPGSTQLAQYKCHFIQPKA